ncbi:MAG: cysteinyl-tRNA synthetase [Parcubacteria group bacterium Athens0714_26]|nr:MAG: cysteinyl-tRNA synthetase [Parcubacteria group bacterium Athens1014_26]TSD03678.1 MAG: cysteinyl-tRNA synthetase [Parcubacteria group bacterium Athens0714_26]
MIKILDSLSGKKEILEPTKNRPLRLFVCGPTVYDYPHIGNYRTFAAFDLIVNYLRSQKYKVFYLQNITDIDNKIIKKGIDEKTSPLLIAKKYEKIYHEGEKKLNIGSVTKYARATGHIKEITKQVQTLLKKGYAYKIKDGWYFNIAKFIDYGKLSGRTSLQAEDAVTRIDESVNKINKGDFALWKFPDTFTDSELDDKAKGKKFLIDGGEPLWKTPLGWGRPGWHIEDTAITEKYFGTQYDIHGGATELKFPHHEAEIAQQESASGKKPLVKIWMHMGILFVDGKKMSKSLNNFISVDDFLKKHRVNVYRYIIASYHYRSPINYTEQLAKDAQKTLDNISGFLAKLSLLKNKSSSVKIEIKKYDGAFCAAMNDDLNSPEALAVIFTFINEINPKIWNLSKKDGQIITRWLNEKLKIFKIFLKPLKIPANIKLLALKRELLRTNKQFAQSDLLRKKIEALGYSIEDTPVGQMITKIES